MAHGPGLIYLFLYGTFLFHLGICHPPILSSSCSLFARPPTPCHPSSWACLSCLASGRKFVKDAPSAASKPETLFFATVVRLQVPTHSLRPDRQRPPTAGPTKARLFHKPASLLPLGAQLTLWVWVWAFFSRSHQT